MKRHASDARDDTRRSPDVKRQRSHGGYSNGNADSSSSYDAQRRYSSHDSYARRTERYTPPPRHADAAQDHRAESERRDAREPSNVRASSGNSNQPRASNSESNSNSNQPRTNSNTAPNVRLLSDAKETDPHRLAQRQKQIDYGKNTVGYDLYCAAVPRHTRRRGVHPMTPDRTLNVSKKAFDGMVRKWRQALHAYDPPELQSAAASTNSSEPAPALDAPGQHPGDTASTATSASATSHCSDKVDLGAAREPLTTTAPSSHDAPRHSIYDNFVEDGGDDVGDDDDDDDLL